jgi:hypothetical protein
VLGFAALSANLQEPPLLLQLVGRMTLSFRR